MVADHSSHTQLPARVNEQDLVGRFSELTCHHTGRSDEESDRMNSLYESSELNFTGLKHQDAGPSSLNTAAPREPFPSGYASSQIRKGKQPMIMPLSLDTTSDPLNDIPSLDLDNISHEVREYRQIMSNYTAQKCPNSRRSKQHRASDRVEYSEQSQDLRWILEAKLGSRRSSGYDDQNRSSRSGGSSRLSEHPVSAGVIKKGRQRREDSFKRTKRGSSRRSEYRRRLAKVGEISSSRVEELNTDESSEDADSEEGQSDIEMQLD